MSTRKDITAKGILRHHFWGEYSATIALVFPDREQMEKALPVLQVEDFGTFYDVNGDTRKSAGWVSHPEKPMLFIHTSGPALEAVILRLSENGADRKKIDSCAKSIDHGEPFKVTIEVEHYDPAQAELFAA